MKTYYEVKFKCYQYNCGGRDGRNGYYNEKKKFPTIEEAIEFSKEVKKHISTDSDESRDFAKQYVMDGFVESFEGIFKVTEERCLNERF